MAVNKFHTSTPYKNAGVRTNDLLREHAALCIALHEPPEEYDDKTPAEIVQGLQSQDVDVKTSAARAARRMLSRKPNTPISVMVDAGVVEPLVQALDRDDCAELQYQAAWAITNIASGTHDHTLAVIDAGAIPKLVTLLSRGGVVSELGAWALGNIAGDGAAQRDRVLRHGALTCLLPSLTPRTPPTQLRTAVWTYSNLCRHKNPMVNFDSVAPALSYITELLVISDEEVLASACWALFYLSDGPMGRIEAVQNTPNLLPRLVHLLGDASPAVQYPALRAVGHMLTGSDTQSSRCLAAGCLEHLPTLLRCGTPWLMRGAARAAANILAGTNEQIQRAFDKGLILKLLDVLEFEDIRCQMEVAWAITYLCLEVSASHLDALLSVGILEPYCALLASPDQSAVIVVLDGLTSLLQAAVKYGQVEPLCVQLEAVGARDQILTLREHEDLQVYMKVVHILDTYFAEQEDATAQRAKTDEQYQFWTSQADPNIHF